MPTSYTSRLRLAKPANGELNNTWGTVVNDNITEMVDQAVAGVSSIALSDANYVLSTANGTSDQARNAVLVFTGALTATRTITTPAVSKLYVVKNSTTGSQSITVTCGGVGVTVPAGQTYVLYTDGVDFFHVSQTVYPALSINALTAILAANLNAGGFKVTNSANGVDNLDLVTVQQLNAAVFSGVLPTQTGQGGKIIRTDGSTASWGDWYGAVSTISSNTALTVRTLYFANTSGGGFTGTLPVGTDGDWVWVVDTQGTFATNNFTFDPAGGNIRNVAENLICDVSYDSIMLVKRSTGWIEV